MGFLDSGSLIAGDADTVIDQVAQLPSALSGKSDRNQVFLAG